MRAAAGLLLALGPVLAGCTSSPPPVRAEVPVWQPGEAWTYAMRDGRTELGWFRYTVQGVEAVPEVTDRAYRVLTERFDHGDVDHDGVADQVVRRVIHFDVATLRLAWNGCDEPGWFGDCKGSTNNEIEFPLWSGKTWTSNSGGDVITQYRHTVYDDDGGDLVVSRFTLDSGTPHQVDIYDPGIGFYAARRFEGGTLSPPASPPEVWTLRDHGLVAVPDLAST